MKRRQWTALLLAGLMVLALLAGCGGSDGDDGKNGKPAKTFEGRVFSIASSRFFPRKNEDGTYVSQKDEAWAAEYEELESRLDIKMEYVPLEGEILELLTSAAMSGTKLADLIEEHQRVYWPAAKAKAILAVDGEEMKKAGLNPFDETRWYVPAVRETKLFDKHWGVMVASKYVAVPTGYFVCFNKELVASAGDYDLYELTRQKKWTWDVYLEIARKVTKDTTGDGIPDIWGTGATAWGSEAISNGVDYIGQDKNSKWVLTIDSPEGMRALQFLYDMNFGEGTRWDVSSRECRQAFADGTIAFNWAHMGHINGPGEIIYDAKHDYGIVPMPMGPDANQYYSMSSTNDALIIQTTVTDLDNLVAIMNEWALIVNDTEDYLDVLDDGRCRTDEDKEMMMNYILPNYKLNYGSINEEIWYLVDEGIISGVSYNGLTPAAAIEQFKPEIQALLDEFFDQK